MVAGVRGFRSVPRLPVALLLGALPLLSVAAEPRPRVRERGVLPGVVVASAEKGGGAADAGLLPGDLLLSWERAPGAARPGRGPLDGPSALVDLELEEAPFGAVRVMGRRGREAREWVLKRQPWTLLPLPALRPAFERLPSAEARAKALEAKGAPGAAAWFYLEMAGEAQDPALQERSRLEALRAARAAGDRTAEAAVLDLAARALDLSGDVKGAREGYRKALAVREASGSPLAPVRSLLLLADCSRILGDVEGHERYADEALQKLDAAGAHGVEWARALNLRGLARLDRGRFDDAERDLLESLHYWERSGPDTLDVARALNNLAIVATERGVLKEAQEYNERALDIKEKMHADPVSIAMSLNNLGNVASDRGDLDRAEAYHRRALAIREGIDPQSRDTARSLNNLGNLAIRRRELDLAEELLTRSLALKERFSPDSFDVASGWLNLGGVALQRGDLDGADLRYQGYLERIRRLAPGSTYEAGALLSLAHVAEQREQGARAEALFGEAIATYEKGAPGSLALAQALRGLGDLLASRGEAVRAGEQLDRALAILGGTAPESEEMAECLLSEARLLEARGQADGALQRMRDAVAVHESCVERLGGGSSARTGYAAQTQEFYHALLAGLAGRGEGRQAFDVLERMRAREFLRMLAQRDLVFTADIPAALDDRRRLLGAEREQAQAQLLELSPETDGEAIAALKEKLRRNGEAWDRFREELVSASPRLAALRYPAPLDTGKALEALDPGTLALAYAVLPEETLLFALGPSPGEFSMHRIPMKAGALALQVRRSRCLLEDTGEMGRAAQTLGASLLGPVAAKITRARRVLLCPDGPLLVLPFSALALPGTGGATRRLAEVAPLHTALSVTVWEGLKRSRAEGGARPIRLLTYADPAPSAALRDLGLPPLPAARAEGEALAALFGPRALLREGDLATEADAKREAPGFPYLHFACHGLLGGVSPLDAALVLAPGPGKAGASDNGLLQAWEIFEGLRLDADLVTLSACDTGVGKVQGGEGLVGLSRAFQYAGARSLLVSLWRVDDTSTAALMRRFYGHLAAGESKDEALRAAQRELWRGEEGPDAALPAHWAAFQLVGDWR